MCCAQSRGARWPGEHEAATALQSMLMGAVTTDPDLRQLAADAFRSEPDPGSYAVNSSVLDSSRATITREILKRYLSVD